MLLWHICRIICYICENNIIYIHFSRIVRCVNPFTSSCIKFYTVSYISYNCSDDESYMDLGSHSLVRVSCVLLRIYWQYKNWRHNQLRLFWTRIVDYFPKLKFTYPYDAYPRCSRIFCFKPLLSHILV